MLLQTGFITLSRIQFDSTTESFDKNEINVAASLSSTTLFCLGATIGSNDWKKKRNLHIIPRFLFDNKNRHLSFGMSWHRMIDGVGTLAVSFSSTDSRGKNFLFHLQESTNLETPGR